MSIVTKNGDGGKTSLFGGKKVYKDDLLVEAYGSLDELSSFIGLVINFVKKEKNLLLSLQKDLYQIMAFLAKAPIKIDSLKEKTQLIEEIIEKEEKKLLKVNQFILPTGSPAVSWFHILRVICRRIERRVISLRKRKNISQKELLIIVSFLNRLSDLFFILARKYNQEKEILVRQSPTTH